MSQLMDLKVKNTELARQIKEKGITFTTDSFTPETFKAREGLENLVEELDISWTSIFEDSFSLENKEDEERVVNLLLLYQAEINKSYLKILEEN